jgi:hypothetical protein
MILSEKSATFWDHVLRGRLQCLQMLTIELVRGTGAELPV